MDINLLVYVFRTLNLAPDIEYILERSLAYFPFRVLTHSSSKASRSFRALSSRRSLSAAYAAGSTISTTRFWSMDGDEEEDITSGRGGADEDDAAAPFAIRSDSAGLRCDDDDGDICAEDAISDTLGSLSGDTAWPKSVWKRSFCYHLSISKEELVCGDISRVNSGGAKMKKTTIHPRKINFSKKCRIPTTDSP